MRHEGAISRGVNDHIWPPLTIIDPVDRLLPTKGCLVSYLRVVDGNERAFSNETKAPFSKNTNR